MVSRANKKLLLIAGGAAVLGYLLLRKGEETVTGIAAPFTALPGAIAAIPAGVQAGAAALTGGIVETIGAAGTGAVGGVAKAVAGGFEELTRPFPQPLRTYKPVPEVRQIPLAEQIGWTEQPVITVEQYEAQQYAPLPQFQGVVQPEPAPAQIPYTPAPIQPAPLPPVEELQQMTWTPVVQPVVQPVSSDWEAGRVVGTRTTGGVQYEIIATGVGKEVEKRRV